MAFSDVLSRNTFIPNIYITFQFPPDHRSSTHNDFKITRRPIKNIGLQSERHFLRVFDVTRRARMS